MDIIYTHLYTYNTYTRHAYATIWVKWLTTIHISLYLNGIHMTVPQASGCTSKASAGEHRNHCATRQAPMERTELIGRGAKAERKLAAALALLAHLLRCKECSFGELVATSLCIFFTKWKRRFLCPKWFELFWFSCPCQGRGFLGASTEWLNISILIWDLAYGNPSTLRWTFRSSSGIRKKKISALRGLGFEQPNSYGLEDYIGCMSSILL